MSKKADPKISGRAVADEKGNQKWVWQSTEEGKEDVDTAVVRALGEGLSLDGSSPNNSSGGSNPYDSARSGGPGTAGGEAGKRRTLDDMRKLSEAIKRSKQKP